VPGVRLSVCIPTHQGRCALLEQTLTSIASQLTPELTPEVEVVVSDNASTDGTEQMIARFRAQHPELELRYARNERDLHLANIMRCVERAEGEWCWLFGSDDLMAEGGLATVLEMIAAHPDAAGIAMARTNFDHAMERRVQSDPPETAPAQHVVTVIEGYSAIVEQLAFQFGFLSVNVVQRELWLAAAAEMAEDALVSHPEWPHLPVFAAIVRRRPRWVWLPTVLVLVRAGRSYLVESHGEEPNLARVHIVLVDGLRRAWREVAADNRALYRALMLRTLRVAANAHAVESIKLSRGHGLAWDARLAWTLLRAFAALRPFWHEVAPLLAAPAPLYQTLRRRRKRHLGEMPALSPGDCRIELLVEAPEHWWAREMPLIRCRLRNLGAVPLRSTGTQPIHVGGRWYSPEGELILETLRDPLPRSLAPRDQVELLVRTHTPWDAGRYRLEMDCVQENVRWFGEVDRDNTLVLEADVELPGIAPMRAGDAEP
jgi:abequosyltransferase